MLALVLWWFVVIIGASLFLLGTAIVLELARTYLARSING